MAKSFVKIHEAIERAIKNVDSGFNSAWNRYVSNGCRMPTTWGQVVFRAIMDCSGYTKAEKEAYIMAAFDENCEWGYPPREWVLECLERDFTEWEKSMGNDYLTYVKI